MEYLFDSLVGISETLRNRRLFIFLDYDGTIAPIVDIPDQADIPRELRKVLEAICANPRMRLAFISGRRLVDIKTRVGLKNAIYSGNKGLEIEGDKIEFRTSLPANYRNCIVRIKRGLQDRLSGVKGIFIEDKELTLSLHYRKVPQQDVVAVKEAFCSIVGDYVLRNQIKARCGKMVFEVTPSLNWNKGTAALAILALDPFAFTNSDLLPVYIGDDIADEDAFRALDKSGLTIYVGQPKISSAKYYVKDTYEVMGFLKEMLNSHSPRLDAAGLFSLN